MPSLGQWAPLGHVWDTAELLHTLQIAYEVAPELELSMHSCDSHTMLISFLSLPFVGIVVWFRSLQCALIVITDVCVSHILSWHKL